MSNKERAAALLTPTSEHCQRVHNGEGGDPCMFCEYNAETAADMLADAGLLAPDAPEPLTAANGNPVWRADGTLMVTRYPDGEIAMLLNPKQEARYTPETARAQAALLLAAANHAEVTE